MPMGMWSATGEAVARAPSLGDIRRGSYGSRKRSTSNASFTSGTGMVSDSPVRMSPISTPITTAPRGSGPKPTGGENDGEGDELPDMVFGRGRLRINHLKENQNLHLEEALTK